MLDDNTMVQVQFGNLDDGYLTIAVAPNLKMAFEAMKRYIAERFPNFTVHYFRYWTRDGNQMIDFGSHSQFFRYVPITEDYISQEL